MLSKVNLGCGLNKLEGYTNVDVDPKMEPDVVCDFTQKLPFETGTVDQVVMFHVIEHIQKIKHQRILLEIRRILKPDGHLIVSFPEFSIVADYWLTNYKGQREFWEATIYGRQSSPSDFHVCIMDTKEFCHLLKISGFRIEYAGPEPDDQSIVSAPYNTVIGATPDILLSYSDTLKETVWNEQP